MAQTITQTTNLQVRSEQSLYRRDGLLCALLMAACLLLAHPFVEMGFVDDWSYIKTAQVFAQTGHFAYNGWATAALGWQILWGALFSKLLGFSFVHIRLSTVPVAMATIYLFHRILVRFGISRGYAIFGALTLGLSPVFMAMSASYLTDVPGLFVTLLCLYLCQRALSASTDRAALAWLFVATVTNVAGGTVRQTAWFGALLFVPSTVWLFRRRHGLFLSGVLIWLAGVAGVFACLDWLYHQPYFIPESLAPPGFSLAVLRHVVKGEIRVSLCTLLLLFPVLAAWWPLARSVPRRSLVWTSVISSVLLVGFLAYCSSQGKLDQWIAPWLPHVIGQMGMPGMDNIPGPKPGPIHTWQRIFVTVLVLGAVLIFFVHLFSPLRRRGYLNQSARMPSWHRIFWLLGPYTLGYMAVLSTRAVFDALFDRYSLVPQAIGIIVLLRYYQDFVVSDGKQPSSTFTIGRLPTICYLALLVFAYYSVAGTHDWFSLDRARVQAAEEIRRSGVPRTAIQGGFEYDGWTQLEAAGYINDPRIRIPKGAFHAVSEPTLPSECSTWFSPTLIPAVNPRYFVVFTPLSCFAPSPFPAVTYHAWMPPFTRKLYVQQRKE